MILMQPLEIKIGKYPDEKLVLPPWAKILWFCPLGVFAGALLVGCFYPVGWIYRLLGISGCLIVAQGLLLWLVSGVYCQIKRPKAEKPSTKILEEARDMWAGFLVLCRGIPSFCSGIIAGLFVLLCIGVGIAAIGLGIYGVCSISVHGLLVIGIILLILILFK
jgi:hypothetical protein